MKPLIRLIALTLYMTGFIALPTAFAQDQPHVTVRLIPERTIIKPGETIQIALEQTIAPHWHTYWLNPGDSGVAPEIEWTVPDGFKAGDFQWPTPRKIPFGPLTNYGYEDKVVLLQPLTAPANLPDGPVSLKAEVTILVCNDICIPETSEHTLTLNDGIQTDNHEIIENSRSTLPRTEVWPATYTETAEDGSNDLLLTISPANTAAFDGIKAETLSIIPHEWGLISNSATPVIILKGGLLTISQARGDRVLSEIKTLRTLLTYTDTQGRYQGFEIEAIPVIPATIAATPPEQQVSATTMPETGFATALLFALLGGLILNLMPCVFPVLSLKAISLSKMSDKEQSHAAASGFAYTAGVILSFTLIAAILMALKAGGAQIGWGFQLQNPVVVYALAMLLFIIGLNLSGVFLLQGGFTNAGQKLAQQNGLLGAFFTGVLATLVATPCTAPFMGAAMGYALTQPAAFGLSIFIALGFGLALPYLLLTLIPPLRKCLPRPGVWMETFKEFLAFPMYASAAWLVWVFAQQAGGMAVLSVLLGMVAVAFTLWAWGRRPARTVPRLLASLIILATLFGGLTLGFGEALKPAAKTESITGIWQEFSASKLEELLQTNDPVFVDMTAAWCITCKVNERVALDNPETHAVFKEKNVQALKGDWTNQNPEITKFLESHGRKGVPLYVVYGSRDPVSGQRPLPEILPQLLTPSIVAAALNK